MNTEIAEQLLYESEATLRLVDSLLDELQDDEPQLHQDRPGLQALRLEAAATRDDAGELPDLIASAASQVRAVLEALAKSRSILERTDCEKLPPQEEEQRESPSAARIRGGLERALLLIDRLDPEPGPAPVQQLLREEIVDVLDGVRAQEITGQQLRYASSVLRETQLQLSSVVLRLSPRRPAVIPSASTRAMG